MHLIKKELFEQYFSFISMRTFEEQMSDCWKELLDAVYCQDLDRCFNIIKRLLWLKKKITIRA